MKKLIFFCLLDPLDMVRGRLSAQGGVIKTQYNGLADGLIKIAKVEGFLSLFSGISATLLGIYPYVALNYLTYETIKEQKPKDMNDIVWRVLAGGISGKMFYFKIVIK